MTRSLCSVLSAVAGAALLCAAPANAQGAVGDVAITEAAVEAVASELHTGERLPRGRIGFDGRVLEARPAPESGPEAVAYVLGNATHPETVYPLLDADRADFELSVVCNTDSPRSCQLPGFVAVFAASRPVPTTGDAVEVVVAVRWRSELAKMPVGYTRYAVTLTRSAAGEWITCSIRTLFIS
jgi:hypothetical protein